MLIRNQLTPLRADGRGANSLLVTTCPLFNPTAMPVLGCFGAITYNQTTNIQQYEFVKVHEKAKSKQKHKIQT